MERIRDGIPASPGVVIGPAQVLRWEVPRVPQGSGIAPEQVDEEIARFREACEAAREGIRDLQRRTAEQLGEVEARIFEPQLMMLEDADLIDGTVANIRDNHLSAARAFEWRVLEWESRWSHTAHPMVLDRLNDLADIQARVLRHLLDTEELEVDIRGGGEKVILVTRDLSPSLAAQLDRKRVIGIATDSGTRTSHSSILARSLEIPSVVSLGDLSERVRTGDELILDGRTGRVIVHPTEPEKQAYRERDFRIREWEQELLLLAHLDAMTRDGVHVGLLANIDLPAEASYARAHGAEGVGLYRTEFLVVGRSSAPGEEEQFQAYRQVAEAFEGAPVVIRTYDLGGDKFPAFLHIGKEENPFLGWRAIRVCLDEPELFEAQLRALLRVAADGNIHVMLPLINDVSEVERTRTMIAACAADLREQGISAAASLRLGAMIETPAAAVSASILARHVDFFSIGTNDLVQYTLAVDRGNSRLARLYNPFHPAVVQLLNRTVEAGRAAGIPVSVCGEFAANPLGAFLLIGMGVSSLSVGPAALAEIKKVIRSVRRDQAETAARAALAASDARGVVQALTDGLPDTLDLSMFAGSWRLPD